MEILGKALSRVPWPMPLVLAVATLAVVGAVLVDSRFTPSGPLPTTTVPARRPPPAMPGAPNPDDNPARFLAQATFGPTLADIAHLRQIGERAWLDEQFAMPPSYEVPYLDALGENAVYQLGHDARMEAWFLYALGGRDPFNTSVIHRDQLRQRVAFALSEIMVISEHNPTLENQKVDAVSSYYDVLVRNAFGNYRTLLEDVTLHPAMGVYLNMLQNQKPDPATNRRPDQNYAREVMQLFSIGLVQLGRDGTPLRDASGATIPTYDQNTVRGFASVFTGWSLAGCAQFDCFFYPHEAPAWRVAMVPFNSEHDSAAAKQLLAYPGVVLAGGVLPAGGNTRNDLTAALDNIFNHPNVGPFVSRQLIQRLVTSNPSPAYVDRVAARFNDNGAGVRGDLQAVVAAILLDRDARALVRRPGNYGKVREPILRLTHLWRALGGSTRTGRIGEYHPDYYLGQAPLRAPSVFNFFSPTYQPPTENGAYGLVAPELQLATDDNLPATANGLGGEFFNAYLGNPAVDDSEVSVDLTRDGPLAANPATLIDRYNTLFLAGRMSPALRSILLTRLNGVPNANGGRDRVQEALYLIINSPDYVVQQ